MNIDAFDFELPPERIAQTPLRDRTSSRLMALNRKSKKITHTHFNHLAEWLQPGDTLVFNDSRVLPARLFGVKQDTGAKAEVLLLKQIEENKWEALVRPGKKLKAGSTIVFSQGSNAEMTAVIEEEREMGLRVLRFQYEGVFYELLERLGQMPLPPYIKSSLQEQDRYQTVYAKERGSAAAPTAGLHFTEAYMEQLQQKGIHLAYVTLHVGLDTFRPVAVDKIEEHEMHSEYFAISAETAKLLNQTRAAGGRIIGVGTTSVRVLETAIESDGFSGKSGWTNIFIYPGYSFQAIDAIITNFHLPKSTLLMMVSAFAGKDTILHAYKEAIEQEYRFFSFGDAMIIY